MEQKRRGKRSILKTFCWIIATLLLLALLVTVITKSTKKEAQYELITPTPSDTIVQVSVLTGSIQPRDEVLIKPQMNGILSELLHLPGDVVQVGDIIARIRMVPDVAMVQNYAARVESARIALRTAEEVYLRDKALWEKNILPREKYELSKGEYDKASIELTSAQEQLELASKGSSTKTATQNNTLVRATISGVILEQPVKVGTSVIQANNFNDGTTIASIADLNELLFLGQVNESDVNSIKVGAKTKIRVGAVKEKVYTAVVEYVSPKGQNKSGNTLFEVKAALDNKTNDLSDLKSGFSGNAEIELSRKEGVLSIPEGCVLYKDNKSYVFVSRNNKDNTEDSFEEREVILGLSDGLKVEVKKGLEGHEKLKGNKL